MKLRMPLVRIARAAVIGAFLLVVPPVGAEVSEARSSGDPMPGKAGDFALKVEPGLAFPLTDPQSERFELGAGQSIKAYWSLRNWFDIGPSVTFVALPAGNPAGESGTAWGFGGGLRLKRPHHAPDDDTFLAASPWMDADLLYVRTGALNRFGFSGAAGISLPLGESRIFWLGPFVRYLQIVQEPTRDGFDNHHAKVLTLGLSLEMGSGVERKREPVPAEIRTVNTQTFSCPDRDGDGLPDKVDRCSYVAGPIDNWGCPPYRKVVVKPDKLELTERIQFAWNDAIIDASSHPVLDEVVQALKDNLNFRVQIEGHASSEGTDDHNQDLSEKRAVAVLDYLASHGIARERLGSKGFSSSVPTETNVTLAGREANRCVEFVVSLIILTDGGK